MNRRAQKTNGIALFLILIASVVFAFVAFRSLAYSPDTEIPIPEKDILVDSDPRTQPVRLIIPSLDIDASVQHVGVNASGNMANPSNFTDVAWYKYGPIPGERGSAVFAGHVDNGLGLSGVFKELHRLEPGDDIYVESSVGRRHFEVVSVKRHPYDAAPVQVIFNDSGSPRLNLITCEGNWVSEDKTYDQRLVVSARLVS